MDMEKQLATLAVTERLPLAPFYAVDGASNECIEPCMTQSAQGRACDSLRSDREFILATMLKNCNAFNGA